LHENSATIGIICMQMGTQVGAQVKL